MCVGYFYLNDHEHLKVCMFKRHLRFLQKHLFLTPLFLFLVQSHLNFWKQIHLPPFSLFISNQRPNTFDFEELETPLAWFHLTEKTPLDSIHCYSFLLSTS